MCHFGQCLLLCFIVENNGFCFSIVLHTNWNIAIICSLDIQGFGAFLATL